jgi:hypothetical protein
MWGSQAYWKNYVSDEFYETFHVFLHKQLNWKIYKHGMKVDVLLFVEAYSAICSNFHSLKKNDLVGTIVLFVDDLHWVNKKMRQQKLKAFQLPDVVIMSTYADQAAQLYPEIDTSKWIWMPHSASRRFIQPSINTTATLQSILLTGATPSMWYPHRAKAAKLSGKSGLISQILHPGYQKSTEKEQKNFVTHMVHFGMGLTDGSSLHYALAKIFEIPATGQLLLLNDDMEAHMRNLCFVPGVHYIGYNEKNMKSIIKGVLSGNFGQKIMQIRTNGQKLIQKIHTTNARAIQLTNIAHCLFRNKRKNITNHSACFIWKIGKGVLITNSETIKHLLVASEDSWNAVPSKCIPRKPFYSLYPLQNTKSRFLFATLTLERRNVGFSYLKKVITSYSMAFSSSDYSTSFEMHVFLPTHNRPISQISHKIKKIRNILLKTNIRFHLLNTSSPGTSFVKMPGIFRPISKSELQHNIDGLAMMRFMIGQCNVQKQSKYNPINTYVVFVEDDWIPCPFLAHELDLITSHPCVKEGITGLRIGSGGAGIVIPCSELQHLSNRFERFMHSAPYDSLLSWLLMQQHGDFDKYISYPQEKRYLVYQRNLFHHIGDISSKGKLYDMEVPRCWETLDGPGILKNEYFRPQCKFNPFSPC